RLDSACCRSSSFRFCNPRFVPNNETDGQRYHHDDNWRSNAHIHEATAEAYCSGRLLSNERRHARTPIPLTVTVVNVRTCFMVGVDWQTKPRSTGAPCASTSSLIRGRNTLTTLGTVNADHE